MNAEEKFDQLFMKYYVAQAEKLYFEDHKSIDEIKQYLSKAECKSYEIDEIIEIIRYLENTNSRQT